MQTIDIAAIIEMAFSPHTKHRTQWHSKHNSAMGWSCFTQLDSTLQMVVGGDLSAGSGNVACHFIYMHMVHNNAKFLTHW